MTGLPVRKEEAAESADFAAFKYLRGTHAE
jgi:hypothetical protein